MRILFEELSTPKRAGGIEMATGELQKHLEAVDISVIREAMSCKTASLLGPKASKLSSRRTQFAGVPDCVHFHGIWSPSLAKRMVEWKRRGVPCLVTLHGMLEPWALAHKRFKKVMAWHLYQKHILNMADALHATAVKEAVQFQKLGLKPPRAVVPWGVSAPKTANCLSLPAQARTALFVGRIYPVKGLPLLIEAWARVKPAGWKMRIVGPDEAGHRAEVESLVERFGLRRDFEFAGPLQGDQKARAYAGAQLFILPSYTENFGMAIGEALAHGLPVITTMGTPWGQLQTYRCGWWVEAEVESLATALGEATRLPVGELQTMGVRGRELIKEQYSWPRIALEMRAVYLWLLGKKERPTCISRDAIR